MSAKYSRRSFLRMSAMVAAGAALAGCAGPTPTPAPEPTKAAQPAAPTKAPEATQPAQPTAAPAAKYAEAPQLAEQVKAGKLPPIEQRLPQNPLVVEATEVGTYGGTWRMGMRGGTDDPSFTRILGYEPLFRWNADWTGIVPNLAEKYEANANATEYTFHLRKGLKWSDGHPFTADDIVFWWEDVQNNPDLTAAPPSWMMSGGKPGKVTKVDDYTVKYTFEKPYGLFIQMVASIDSRSMTQFPKHYGQQFHAKYADKAKLDELVKAGGFPSWKELFIAKVGQPDGGGWGPWGNVGRPLLFAWMVEQPYSANATQVTLVRNPYYFKVDQKGQQYPYIDKLVYDVFQDIPAMLLKATNGEIDFQMRHFNTLPNKAVLFDNQQKGGYHFFDLVQANSNSIVIHLNLTHKDPTMRQIFQNKDFRIGLSHALNRQEIIDTVYVGQAKPMQPAALEGTPFYNKQLATQYLEYDVKKANEYLDKVLPKKDANGMRLRPDGKPLTFAIEVANANQDQVDAVQFIVKYWKAVGVGAEAKVEDRSLMYERKNNNDLDAMLWGGEAGYNPILDPRNFFPWGNESAYAVAWALWNTGVTAPPAEEPPDWVKKFVTAFDKVKASPTWDEQVKAMNEILQMSADAFFCMGISTMPAGYGIAKNNMHNVPKSIINSWAYPSPAPVNTFTFFYSK